MKMKMKSKEGAAGKSGAAPPKAPRTRRTRDKPNVDQKWFIDRLADKGLSMRRAAGMLGMNSSLISRRLSGETTMSPSDVDDLATLLGQPYDEVLRRAGLHAGKPSHTARIVGIAGKDGAVTATRERATIGLPGGELSGMEGVAVDAPGALLDKAVLFYNPSRQVEPSAVGKLALVGIGTKAGGRTVLGVLRQGFDRGNWDVETICGETVARGLRANWAAPVVWARL
jgi:transcriptional regulator with XRE-family HTH domain